MKCLISDFDGTLYDSNFGKNIEKIREFCKENNIFVVATGRTYESILEMMKSYNIPFDFLICSDGACIYNNNNDCIYSSYMPCNLKVDVLKFLDIYNIKELKYDNNLSICQDQKLVSRILLKCEDRNLERKISDELNLHFESINSYLSENWLNISYKKNTKLSAIKYLERYLKGYKIYTIGNDINDVQMIEYYDGYMISKKYNGKYIESVSKLIDIIK